MAFRKISYLIPVCDGCGLAWSFFDPACTDGIPPHSLTGLPRWSSYPRTTAGRSRPSDSASD